MNTFLIGVTGERSEDSKKVIFAIMNCLSLLHINIRQPFIDVLASITSVSPLVASGMQGTERIGKLNCTVAAFEREFYACICGVNNRYFIETLGEHLTNSMEGFTPTTRNLFSGHIVSGINRPEEATYIRAKGGIMLHICNNGEGWPNSFPREAKLFDLFYHLDDGALDEKSIASVLIPQIRETTKRAA